MSEAQALIDDIAAEYPELSRDDDQDQTTLHNDLHTASLQLEYDELAAGGEEQGTHHDGVDGLNVDHDHHDDDGGHNGPPDMSGLTDEALRQFANAAAMHFELNNGQDGGRDDEQGKGMHEVEQHQAGNEYVDPSLSQVVASGSIPPPPRPTYQTSHAPSLRLDPADLASLHDATPQPPTSGTSHKRKRGTSFTATEQPLQAQGDPSKKDRANEANLDPALGGDENQNPMFDVSRAPMHPAPDAAPAPPPPTTGRGKRGPGARVKSQGAEEAMCMPDGGAAGEGSDGGRKDGKDERSQRRAEQNRRAQQNFRKRREEQMKLQEARLKELEPQMEAMQRQQAETHLLLEALKLENTALRAVLVHSVKQGARILDPSGELVGASASLGLAGMNRDSEAIPTDETAATGDAQGDDEMASEETARAVEDVYAALDRLGARTHVYARTIVPLTTDEHSAPTASHTTHTPGGARNMEIPSLNGPMIAQSSMRTVQHPQQPLQQQPIPPSAHQQPPQPFPTSNLPPFPVRPEPQQEQQQSMDMAEIDPSLENSHQGEGLMDLNLA